VVTPTKKERIAITKKYEPRPKRRVCSLAIAYKVLGHITAAAILGLTAFFVISTYSKADACYAAVERMGYAHGEVSSIMDRLK
jgi:hypothetical protein